MLKEFMLVMLYMVSCLIGGILGSVLTLIVYPYLLVRYWIRKRIVKRLTIYEESEMQEQLSNELNNIIMKILRMDK